MTLLLLLVSVFSVRAIPAGWESGFLHDTLREFNQAYLEAHPTANVHPHAEYESPYHHQGYPESDREDSFNFVGVSDEMKDVFACYKGDEVNSYGAPAPNHTQSHACHDAGPSLHHEQALYHQQDHPQSLALEATSNSDFFAGVSGIIDKYKQHEGYDDGEEEISSSLPYSSEVGASTVYEPFDELDLQDSLDWNQSQEGYQHEVSIPLTQVDAKQKSVKKKKIHIKSDVKRGVAALQHHSNIKAPRRHPNSVYSYGFPDPLWYKKIAFPVAKIKARMTYEKYATKEGRRLKKFEDRCNLAAGRDLLYGS